MPRITSDLLLGGAFIIIGIGAISIITSVEQTALASRDILDFKTLPVIYAGLLLGLSALLVGGTLTRAWLARRAPTHAKPEPAQASGLRSTVLICGTLALVSAYALALSRIPFFVATAVFLIACLLFYGRRPWWRVVLLGLVGAGALHWLFIEIIHLPLR